MAFLTIAGADIFYELTGSGRPAIVLVHGGMCDHRDWAPIIPTLARRHSVLTLDLRSHGRSGGDPAGFSVARCAADVNRMVEALGLAPAMLVGHSFGTRVAAEAVWSAPGAAIGLALLDGSRSVGGKAAGAPAQRRTPLEAILSATIGPHLQGVARTRLLETMAGASPALMAACVAAIESWDRTRADTVFSGLPERLPVLAIQSTYHDQATPRRSLGCDDRSTPYLDFLRETVARLDARILPNTGHFSMIERPDIVGTMLLACVDDALNDKPIPGRGPQ